MRLLADANVEAEVVRWLREEGHDITSALDLPPRTTDRQILSRAEAEQRILLTNDKDFGEFAVRCRIATVGIILLRYPSLPQHEKVARLRAVWHLIADNAAGNFVVVSDVRIRVRPLQ